MSELLPTFRNNKDRLVYLLAEYKVPLSIMVLAAGVWLAWATPQVPSPPDTAVAWAVVWFFLALPCYVFFHRLAKYLHDPPVVSVGVADPGTKAIYGGVRVPIQLWETRTTTGYPAIEPDGDDELIKSFDFLVTAFKWYDDIRELEVRGVDPDLEPGAAWESAERVDEVYNHLHAVKRAYSQLKATVQRYATDVHDATLMQQMAEEEGARLSPEVSISAIIEQMESDVGDLPDAPVKDHQPQHVERWGMGELDDGALPPNEGGSQEPPGGSSTNGETAPARSPAATDGGTEQ